MLSHILSCVLFLLECLLYLPLSLLPNCLILLLLASLLPSRHPLFFPGGYLLIFRCYVVHLGFFLVHCCPSGPSHVNSHVIVSRGIY